MKRIDLERHLREQGCLLYREGGGHREIKEGTARAICKQLEISQP